MLYVENSNPDWLYWLTNNGGANVFIRSKQLCPSVRTCTAGSFNPTVTAEDSFSATGSATTALSVTGSQPTVSITFGASITTLNQAEYFYQTYTLNNGLIDSALKRDAYTVTINYGDDSTDDKQSVRPRNNIDFIHSGAREDGVPVVYCDHATEGGG